MLYASLKITLGDLPLDSFDGRKSLGEMKVGKDMSLTVQVL